MPVFEIHAYQEMFTNVAIEAETRSDAIRLFHAMVSDEKVTWQPSDEDLEIMLDDDEANEADAA